ncbi:hypothetical protein AALB53_08340 [Lachnospiraceae bacterium 47-T17]
MFEELIKSRSYYERKILDTAVRLERAKINNAQADKLSAEFNTCKRLLDEVKEYRNNLALLKTAVTTEINEYQNRRVSYLNDIITDALTSIFLDEGYSADIHCDFSRKNACKLLLHDRSGNVSSPYIGQGKLMQYLISFAAVSGITRGLGYKNLFIDEAFGVSDMDRLSEIGDVIQKQVESGMQVVLISQNPALYAGLPRHMISLHKDPIKKKVVVDKEEDI